MPATKNPSIVELANRLGEDIRERKLTPGEPYLTASEAALKLGVSTQRANRTLQLLSVRRQIVRSRGSAPTILDPYADQNGKVSIRKIHIFIPKADMTTEGIYSDGCLLGLQKALPDADIHLNFFPAQNEGQFTQDIVTLSTAKDEMAGFVLVRSSIESQLTIAESGLPAVIHGSPYPGVKGIPSIDRDYIAAADLHVDYFQRKGCSRIILLMHDHMYAGGFLFKQALQTKFESIGFPHCAITPIFIPVHEVAAQQTLIDHVSNNSENTGVIVFGGHIAEVCCHAMKRLNLKNKHDLFMTYGGYYATGPKIIQKIPHEESVISPEEQGELVGRILEAQINPANPTPEPYRMEMQFVES
ncbi:hypothetical protein [Poriferisphaera sp. WC338]|uniref:hypothetical protein n=1 Tax=Poriferisphaera sp. WC338 TaxID=3425129 RepID=UPI003D814085